MNSLHLHLNISSLPQLSGTADGRPMPDIAADHAAPFLDALREIAPLIARHRASFDQARQLHEEVHHALAEAGLFRLWLPRSLGGPELSPLEFMRVVESASALDGTVGWLVGNGGGMSRAGGYLSPEVVREWFQDRRTFIVAATGAIGSVTPVDGGFRVSGRFPFGSGAPHGSHFMGLATLGGNQAPDQPRMCCYFDRKQVTLHDTWHVSGLRGTGSSDWEVNDAFVPEARIHPFIDHKPAEPGLIYRMPAISIFAWTVAVVPLGIARGTIDSFVILANGKGRLGSAGLMRDREVVQSMVGRAETLHGAARALLVEAMTELMAATDIGGTPLVTARVRLRAAAAHAAETALRIVDMLAMEAGAAAIFESGSLERQLRDVQAASRHIAMNPSIYAVAGRLELGMDPGPARF
jgi:alkylation response protein AidB-like acyl-CoA dehydrogenase